MKCGQKKGKHSSPNTEFKSRAYLMGTEIFSGANVRPILITGASGLVGSILAQHLIKKNLEVDLIDNGYIHSHLKDISGVPIKKIDIRDDIDTSIYDVIIHCAAIAGINECEKNPEEAYSVNVKGTYNLLRNFKGRFLFPSSSAVYGQAEHPEIDETHPVIPRSVYGKNKFEAEGIIKLHSDYCILRFSNIYGKGIFCKRTVADCFVENALKKETLLIHGDGKQRRDFVHINDVVRSYIVAMRSDINGIFNIGGNEALSINDIAELVSKNYRNIFGYTIEVKHIPIDCGVSWKDFTYSSKLAKEMLGYEPAYSINDEIRERFNAHNRTL